MPRLPSIHEHEVAFCYVERNKSTDPCNHTDNYGLVRNDLTEKPAYWTAKNYLTR
jgi:hypothetical protein